jgi:hypothetical protein
MELNTVVESRARENLWVDQEDKPLLAAAIVALLVEYQRYTSQRDDHEDPQSAQTNWRLLARGEQLRG